MGKLQGTEILCTYIKRVALSAVFAVLGLFSAFTHFAKHTNNVHNPIRVTLPKR